MGSLLSHPLKLSKCFKIHFKGKFVLETQWTVDKLALKRCEDIANFLYQQVWGRSFFFNWPKIERACQWLAILFKNVISVSEFNNFE